MEHAVCDGSATYMGRAWLKRTGRHRTCRLSRGNVAAVCIRELVALCPIPRLPHPLPCARSTIFKGEQAIGVNGVRLHIRGRLPRYVRRGTASRRTDDKHAPTRKRESRAFKTPPRPTLSTHLTPHSGYKINQVWWHGIPNASCVATESLTSLEKQHFRSAYFTGWKMQPTLRMYRSPFDNISFALRKNRAVGSLQFRGLRVACLVLHVSYRS